MSFRDVADLCNDSGFDAQAKHVTLAGIPQMRGLRCQGADI